MVKDSATWQIIGALTHKFVAPSGKFCAFSVETVLEGRKSIHSIKSFDAEVCRALGNDFGIGEMVEVSGELASMVLTNRDKTPVEVGGRKYYETVLKATILTSTRPLEAAHREVAKQKAAIDPLKDDEVPF